MAAHLSPESIGAPDSRWSFPWWLFGILVSSPASILAGFVIATLLVWQRKRIQMWAWRLRGRLPW